MGPRYRVKYYHDTVVGRFSWRFILSVWRDIRDSDLVRIEDVFSTYIPASLLYASLFRKPVLISPRGVFSRWALASKRHWLKRIWLALLISPFVRKAHWHATSVQEEQDIRRLYPDAKIFLIPNGIDLAEFERAAPCTRADYLRRFAFADRGPGPVIVSMGRLHRAKGFDILIDAFAEVVRSFEQAVLLIAGSDDGAKAELQERVARLALREKVFFVGELLGDDKVLFLSGADLFVLPSHSENFGNVYLEAMACGVPVVASRQTPWQNVEAFGCGRWVENTAEATASAMRSLLISDRNALSTRAKMLASRYDWAGVATQFRAAFDGVLARAAAVGDAR
jgi:glycosyltransferase involved in cell wall biosynthesis